jgi:hypothetical protein
LQEAASLDSVSRKRLNHRTPRKVLEKSGNAAGEKRMTFQERKRADAREAQIAAQIDALKRWLEEKHPGISAGEATIKAFQEDMGNAFLVATDEDFEYSLATTRTIFSRRIRTEAEVKADLIDEIMDSLQFTNNPHWGVAHNIATERKKMAFWSIESLRARLNEVIEAQRLQKLSAGQIRQELRTSRPAPQKNVLPAEVTPAQIHAMRSTEIRALIRSWGADAVNSRLFGRS